MKSTSIDTVLEGHLHFSIEVTRMQDRLAMLLGIDLVLWIHRRTGGPS